jgi:hypothetical protein
MKFIYISASAFVLLFGCISTTSSKNADLISPCAGCDDRVMPKENLKYTV